jgi:hypothetical protein
MKGISFLLKRLPSFNKNCSFQIRIILGSRIQIRIRVKSWFRFRIRIIAHESQQSDMDAHLSQKPGLNKRQN